jgi:ABC-type uncharacterized transport system involved in gliding motility auxiliary subunit
LNDKRNSKGFVLVTLEEKNSSLFGDFNVEFKEIKIRPIVQKELDCEDYENVLIDASDTEDAIVEVRLTNLTPLQSIEIQNAEIKAFFPEAMSVSVKREFKKGTNETDVTDVEALSLEEYFLEHIKEDADEKEYDRLKAKIGELFAQYEEANDDSL